MFLGDKNTDGKLNGLDVTQLLADLDIGGYNLSSVGDFTQGSNPAETITETTSPTSFNFSGSTDRDLHDQTDVTISNGTTASVTEDVTVELYDGSDTTGTLLDSETQSVTVSASSTTTVTFLTVDLKLDTGTYHIEITTSGTTLAIDQTDESTKGAAYTFGQTATGDLYVRDQDGADQLRVNTLDGLEAPAGLDMQGTGIKNAETIFGEDGGSALRTANGGSWQVQGSGGSAVFKAHEGGPIEHLTNLTTVGTGSGDARLDLDAGANAGDAPALRFVDSGVSQFEIRKFADQSDLEFRDMANSLNLLELKQNGGVNIKNGDLDISGGQVVVDINGVNPGFNSSRVAGFCGSDGGGNAWIEVWSDDNEQAGILLGNEVDNWQGRIHYNDSVGRLELYTNKNKELILGSNWMRIPYTSSDPSGAINGSMWYRSDLD